MLDSFVLNETMIQGIVASEREMNQMECTRNFMFNRFITIAFDDKDLKRSKVQGIADYLMDVKDNAIIQHYTWKVFSAMKMMHQLKISLSTCRKPKRNNN